MAGLPGMPDVSFLPDEWQGVVAIVFLLSMGIFAAWARTFGKKEGPPAPKVQELHVAGQFSDMGPVKELVAQMGLLVQQQLRTGIAQETTAKALAELGDMIAAHLAELRAERAEREADEEMMEKAKVMALAMVKEMTPPRRRASPRKKPVRPT